MFGRGMGHGGEGLLFGSSMNVKGEVNDKGPK